MCHRHRGTGVAPGVLHPLPSSAGVAMYKYYPEGSRGVSLGRPLGRQPLAVPLEAICECFWSNKLTGNAKAAPARLWPTRGAGGGHTLPWAQAPVLPTSSRT